MPLRNFFSLFGRFPDADGELEEDDADDADVPQPNVHLFGSFLSRMVLSRDVVVGLGCAVNWVFLVWMGLIER